VIDIDFSVFTFLYVSAGMALILGLWFYYDRRDVSLYERIRVRHTFHCIQCGTLYSERGAREVSRCPHCGFENAKLKF
jgi:rRNA maturation endonuclease Nob1